MEERFEDGPSFLMPALVVLHLELPASSFIDDPSEVPVQLPAREEIAHDSHDGFGIDLKMLHFGTMVIKTVERILSVPV